MIGLNRLKRAIGDVPTGGMQTGDPKVRLKLCDAQRLEVEFNTIVAERDTLKQQSAELAAQVEVLLSVNFETLQHDLIIETERAIKQRDEYLRTKVSTAGHGGSHDTCFGAILRNYFPHLWNSAPEPAKCLLEVKADAVHEFVNYVIDNDLSNTLEAASFQFNFINKGSNQ